MRQSIPPFRAPDPVRIRPPKPEPTGVVAPLERATLLLTNDIIVQAKRYVESGATKGQVVEWRDSEQMALVLRLTSTAATWYVRRRTASWRLGTIQDTGVRDARELARKVLAFEAEGLDPRRYLDKMRKVRSDYDDGSWHLYQDEMWIDADGEIHGPNDGMPDRIWSWAHLRKKFLADKLPRLSPRWASQYGTLLHHECFADIEEKPVGLLKYRDLERVKKKLERVSSDKKRICSAAKTYRIISAAREMLDWAYAENSEATGLDELEFVFWARWSTERKSGTREHSPTIRELARTLVLVEHLHATSDGKRGAGAVDASVVGALWATVLTAQRAGQLLRTPTGRYFISPDTPDGWKCLSWTPEEMKTVKGNPLPHSLPIPPETIEIIERYRSNRGARGSKWLFPSSCGEGCVSVGGLGGLLRRLQGIRHKGKKKVPGQGDGRKVRGKIKDGSSRKVGIDLLAEHGIEPWVPHDARRSLETFLDDRRLGGAGSAILSHREHKKGDEKEHMKERALPVTRIHYSKAQKIGLKAEGIALWTRAVLDAYEVEKRDFASRLKHKQEATPPAGAWSRPAVAECFQSHG
ncbi:hypothetical protein HCU64_14775 [Methylobacterium sp. C25]|uniref:hypothetical protein n=1 Tax=Methylobacterium sp. C25 TaxID=2721622 RepID=UPI001F24E94F|nr:hypothetical protein [Methylobacterium sp. C25]MCE4225021.1 hypothetical protein [Methylobacterium sp. C25]